MNNSSLGKEHEKKYWSNVYAMLGVALIATAFFQDHWFWGSVFGVVSIIHGSKLVEG